ncbi:DnaD domain-containing protein [Paenibacillus woosongensis]|uniref:DnaD domain protein n=1 Tax=Paenibacillus woosongensis TaxID=307580 RepID=A0A7X3CN54_9BACL|nr:DnaD domain-containing protein [Paenibacillus woosongensis]MUG44640.1 DnaD domain protein [Paenibacillus woosongensis]
MALTDGWKVWAKGVAFGMEAGVVHVPSSLLTHYRKLGLSDTEVMLLLQLVTYKQLEHNDFPSMEQLEQRMGKAPGEVSSVIQRLMKNEWISIDMEWDERTGIQFESYNLAGMYERLAQCLAEERAALRQQSHQREPEAAKPEANERNLFVIFEKEFARPLSPMECETISSWVDQDGYPEELILLALKEAVFAGKVHFRYIDRILLEWNRNRVHTVEDAKAYAQKFRSLGR